MAAARSTAAAHSVTAAAHSVTAAARWQQQASRLDLEVGDTALGRLAEQRKKEFRLTARKFTEEEWAKILAARMSESNEATEYDNNGTFGEEEEV